MTKREAAYKELVKMVGIHEIGANNHGPQVEQIQRDDALKSPDIGYPWCQSTQNEAWLRANGELLADGTASVNAFRLWAQQNGYLVANTTPVEPYDHICYWLSGGWNHVGIIEQVLSGGASLHLHTIEGNTGVGDVLSSDTRSGRDGVYIKDRRVQRTSVSIVRVPGIKDPPQVVLNNKKIPQKIPHWVWAWTAWRLGEKIDSNHDYRGHRLNPHYRPKTAPRHIPAWTWDWLDTYLANRKRD